MQWFYGLLLGMLFSQAIANTAVLDIAHRGYAAINPESTLQAFRNAHELGADGIEFDVRQTQDGVLVVSHDPNIPALNNRPLENIAFSELYMATEIPSLDAVLLFAKQSGQTVWLEIKQSHRYPNIIERVLNQINYYELAEVTVIQSFNHTDLYTIHRKQPGLNLLALYVNNFSLRSVATYINFVGLPIVNRYLDSSMIEALHQSGKQVIFWRRNHLSENRQRLQSFIDAGADGFMLDRPLKVIMQAH
ncbi:MAG: glycerophosphodiester phosphodiesterase [Leucothrix sp.]